MKILIVEDDLSLLTGLSFAIKRQGYELDIAKTCIEADDIWQPWKYDLVILDVSLPDGSGFDICKKNPPDIKGADYFSYRRRRRNGHIPTIEVDTEARESCLKLNKMLLVVLKQLC